MKALIPGLNNLSSIGSVPTLRKAYNHSVSYTPWDFKSEYFPSTDWEIAQQAVRNIQDSPVRRETPKNEIYNPITNPIPWVNQNPYIMNERTILGTEGP